MVEEIYEIKNEFLQKMRQEIDERGIERVDVGEMYKLADIVKDLAEAEKSCWEAEYYRGVSEAMEGQGYMDEGMGMYGYSQGGSQGGGQGGGRSGGSQGGSGGGSGYRESMGYRRSGRGSANQYGGSGGRRGYENYRRGFDMEGLRMAMQSADPQEKERMRREIQQMMSGQM